MPDRMLPVVDLTAYFVQRKPLPLINPTVAARNPNGTPKSASLS
jgi:hypothetical protein